MIKKIILINKTFTIKNDLPKKKDIVSLFAKFYYLLTISDFQNLNCLQIQMSYNKLWKNQKDFRNNIIHYLLHRVYKKKIWIKL